MPHAGKILAAVATLAFVVVAVRWGFFQAIDPSEFPPAQRASTSYGRNSVDRVIQPGSAEARAVADWLQSHAHGWRISFMTYRPVRRIDGDGYNLNFLNDFCVLNYVRRPSGEPRQIVRTLQRGEPIPDVFPPPPPPRRSGFDLSDPLHPPPAPPARRS